MLGGAKGRCKREFVPIGKKFLTREFVPLRKCARTLYFEHIALALLHPVHNHYCTVLRIEGVANVLVVKFIFLFYISPVRHLCIVVQGVLRY